MKTFLPAWLLLCSLNTLFVSVNHTYGQCSNNEPSQQISYNTWFAGGGNDIFNLNFPQFDPALGTLVKVDIVTLLTLKYTYTLENTDSRIVPYKVWVNRIDTLRSSVLIAPLSSNLFSKMGTHTLSAADAVQDAGPDFISVGPIYAYKDVVTSYSLNSNLAGFLGNGNVTFEYESITDSYPSGSSHYLYNTSASDSINTILTYYYCPLSILPADIRSFTASKLPSGDIRISWLSPNDLAGKKYVIEKSEDGKLFSMVKTIVSDNKPGSSYTFNYSPAKEDKTIMFFRIKEIAPDGAINYSVIRDVRLQDKDLNNMKVYPTIARNSFNIYFPNTAKGDWQVTIISMSGQVMAQTSYLNTNFIQYAFNVQLPAGYYFVEAINKKTQESQRSQVIIQE